MKDFFISYNKHDRAWAEWIAWELEEAGYTVVIQAWDFVGNWVLEMDRAMRDTERTIAVLSPHYVNATYTQSEWANAFRRDGTGKHDLLIPVRVEPVDLEGILAQIVYVDFVNRTAEEAQELLLKRVRQERGKPSSPPRFPGIRDSINQPGRVIERRPVFPGKARDIDNLKLVRDAIVRWRGKYAGEATALAKSLQRAQTWMSNPPNQYDDAIVHVIRQAAEVARDLQSIPIAKLEFANAYGLGIHPTVFWGSALSDVFTQAESASEEARANMEALNLARVKAGLEAVPPFLDRYGFEQLARVLEAGVALLQFDLDRLPVGYLEKDAQPLALGLLQYRQLLLARLNDNPGLSLLATDTGVIEAGRLVARNLPLTVLCAQKNSAGSLDVIAEDSQTTYYWEASSTAPTMEFAFEQPMLCARFVSSEPQAPAITIDSHMGVRMISPDGTQHILRGADERQSLQDALVWFDPLNPDEWCAIGLDKDKGVVSGARATFANKAPGESLWNAPIFVQEAADHFGTVRFNDIYTIRLMWTDICSMALEHFQGLPCLMVSRKAQWGEGIQFLDPKTLASIREPMFIPMDVSSMTLAGGRWLFVGGLSSGETSNRFAVFDLLTNDRQPIGGWYAARADVYSPIVTAHNRESFETMQIVRSFDKVPENQRYQLMRFGFPDGKCESLAHYSDLRIWKVEQNAE